MLLAESVEDYVGAENPVRVIDAFIEGLDLNALGFELKAEHTPGAPPYEPKAFLKLYGYGYLNRIRSSRELEKATQRNLEVIWLLGRLTPDHWTINAFRREHRARFKALFGQFNLVCGSLGLFGAELVAIDGTFLKAVNSPRRNFSAGKVRRMIEEIDRRTEAYLEALESAEREAPAQSMAAAGRERYRTYYESGVCADCPVRARCTRGAYRKLAVHEHQELIAAARARLRERPEMMARRHALAEHPFGTLKFWMGYRAFLCRGLEMVRAEFSLSCLAYNLKRALNVLGVERLLEALRAAPLRGAALAA